MVAELVPSCMMIHSEEIMFEKADKGRVYEKRECGMLRFSKEMSRDFLHSQSVHFTTVIPKYPIKKKKICTINRGQQKYIEILLLILSYENHSSTKLHMLLYTHCCIHNLKESLANNQIGNY